MAEIIIYSSGHCHFCDKAKQLLDMKNVKYQELHVDQDPDLRQEMVTKTGRRTVPQIFINGQHIGGCDDLYALDKANKLDELLK